MTAPTRELIELAQACGVATEYWDWQGRHMDVSAETIATVLAALGHETATPEQTQASLRAVRDAPWRRTLPPVVVAPQSDTPWVFVHVPDGSPVTMELALETGERRRIDQLDRYVEPRVIDGARVGEATFVVPAGLPLGWHEIVVDVDGAPSRCPLVITPDRLELPVGLARRPATGVMAQIYATRSRRSWGMGDFADLADLSSWAATELGCDFTLVNPLHAAEPVAPVEPSPYLPTTRRFVSPLYIRVEEIPEVGYLDAATRAELQVHADAAHALDAVDVVDRDAVWQHKDAALRLVFAQPRSGHRERDFAAFLAREGQGLVDFATWCAFTVHFGGTWGEWPAELHDPSSAATRAKSAELADEVRYHCWLQWVADAQLAGAQRTATDAGMRLGIMHDLAVGVHPSGADAWALADALARNVTVGAPADQYNQIGQDWSQPPWRPDRLAELGYAPYRDMLRTVLRSAGALRVDHIIGLFRLWWIPQGKQPFEGTYVRYDHNALIGILALEAHRAGAVVIGEDLGTVEPWVREYLAGRGILGTSILWFEKDDAGHPLRPESYRTLCLATVTTHDLPPTLGYLRQVHVDLRAELGVLTRPVEEERELDRRDRDDVERVLVERGLLRPGARDEEVVEALYRFLSWTPAVLRGISVSDLAGDTRIINQPGTDEEYPNWRVPLANEDGSLVYLEDLAGSARAKRIADTLR